MGRMVAGLVAVLGALTTPALTPGAELPDALTLEYRVLREGEPIGRHRAVFERSDGRLIVDARMRATVDFAFFTLYRYALDAREVWRNGRLVRFESTADVNGEHHEVRAIAKNGAMYVESLDSTWTAPPSIVPSSLWHRQLLERSLLFDIVDGDRLDVTVTKVGKEEVPVRGGTMRATHYRISGDLERDVWYDADGRLVHVRLTAHDGSDVVYVLQ